MPAPHARSVVGLVGRALTRPALVPLLLRSAWRFRRRGWYRRLPFLPLPPAEYLRWRLHTAYGRDDVLPPTPALERYLRWAEQIADEGDSGNR